MTTKRKPYELEVNPLPLNTFTFDKSKRKLVAEASDFGGAFKLNALFNDACDVGIAIESPFSGRCEKFVLVDEARDREGDVQYWLFQPLNELANVSEVIIFND